MKCCSSSLTLVHPVVIPFLLILAISSSSRQAIAWDLFRNFCSKGGIIYCKGILQSSRKGDGMLSNRTNNIIDVSIDVELLQRLYNHAFVGEEDK